MLSHAKETKEREAAELIVKENAKEDARKAFIAAHPELSPVDPKTYDGLKKGAANLRKELKEAFPGIKFSVRSESYSGGCSIDIKWEDGPMVGAVENVSGKYQEGHFNGMEDIYEHNYDNVWTDVFGGAKYVMTSRSSSNAGYLHAAKQIAKEYVLPITLTWHVSNWGDEVHKSLYVENSDDVGIDEHGHWRANQMINRKISETDFREVDLSDAHAEIHVVYEAVENGQKMVVRGS